MQVAMTRKVVPEPTHGLDVQLALMPVEHVLDDRESKTGATDAPAMLSADPVEAFGQPRQMLGRDARAVIGDR